MKIKYIVLFLLVISYSFSTAAKVIEVKYNRTAETIMILRALSEDDYFFIHKKADYKGRPLIYEARQYFKDFKKHEAVKATQQMLEETKDIGGMLFQGVLYAEELPNAKVIYGPALPFWKQNKQKLIAYMKILKHFYQEANVEGFLTKYNSFYTGAVTEANKYMNNKVISIMESYFGKKNESYTVLLMPLAPYGWGFSNTVGSNQIAMVSPVDDIEWHQDVSAYKQFGFAGTKAKEHYRELVTHEFTHTFITDVLEATDLKTQINQYDSLYTPALDSVMGEEGYNNWWGFVNEHMVRLGEIRVANVLNPADAKEMRKENVNEGRFILLPDAEQLITLYEKNRNQYKTIDAFLPILIKQFGKYNKTDIDNKLKTVYVK